MIIIKKKSKYTLKVNQTSNSLTKKYKFSIVLTTKVVLLLKM